MLPAFHHSPLSCNRRSKIYNLQFLHGVLVGRAPQWHRFRGDILKSSRRALTCSAIGKPRNSRYLNSCSNMLKKFHEWIKRWIKTPNRVERLSFSSINALDSSRRCPFQLHRIALESFSIAEWQMMWPPCHQRFLHGFNKKNECW